MNCTGQDGKLWRVHTEVVLSAASSEDCHGSAAQLWLAPPPRSPLPNLTVSVRTEYKCVVRCGCVSYYCYIQSG